MNDLASHKTDLKLIKPDENADWLEKSYLSSAEEALFPHSWKSQNK